MSRNKKLSLFTITILIVLLAGYGYHKIRIRKNEISGFMQKRQLDEISGIAASGIFPEIYYVHNDSGDTSRFFAISPQGKLITTFYYQHDAKLPGWQLDCEDIAVGPGPEANRSYVYLGDIGDNNNERDYITVYRFEEKKSWLSDSVAHVAPDQLHLTYPDGPKDAETLMVDPIQNLLYIINKRTDTIRVYTTPLYFKANETRILTMRCKLYFPGFKPFKYITAGDISKDGKKILVKSYGKVYYWQRKNAEPVWTTVQRKPRELYYEMQKQGEAIGFTPDGKCYYTTSEGLFAAIYYYHVPD
jgi:hypothetical protein